MKRIFLATPTMHGEEQDFIKEAFDTNWIAPLGKNVEELEKSIREYLNINGSVALASGTSALHMAMKLVGLEKGDIVFCSDLTFSATVNPVSYEGATQVFIDSEKDTWNMDPKALELAFEKYPNAKAVVCANLYGVPAKLDEIKAICEKHNVPLIEDAAESLGSKYKGKQTGTFGDYCAISFNGNKIITTSGGGMFLSNDLEACHKVLFWATQSREPFLHYEHKEIGYNYRMSNIVAGIGRGQMLHLDEHVALKRNIYEKYKEGFANIPAIKMNPYLDCSEPNFWLSCITIDPASGITPDMVIDTLNKENIESRPIWKPMHLQPVFEGHDFITLDINNPVGEEIFNHGLCLPSDIKNTDEDMNRIIGTIRKLF